MNKKTRSRSRTTRAKKIISVEVLAESSLEAIQGGDDPPGGLPNQSGGGSGSGSGSSILVGNG